MNKPKYQELYIASVSIIMEGMNCIDLHNNVLLNEL